MLKNFQDIVNKLIAQQIDNPILESRMLISGVLMCEPSEVNSSMNFDFITAQKIEVLLQRRLRHEPLDKILGQKEFYKYNFVVNKDVLSPRPETEILLEKALEILHKNPSAEILDLGTGSGCIIESLLKEFPQASGVALDISPAALRVAQINAHKLGITERITFLEKNWFDWQFRLEQKFDLITSNPPYIPSADILKLETEVKNYDPLVALDGGIDGLASYRKIAKLSLDLLKDNGYILLEVGINQADAVAQIFSDNLKVVELVSDLSGIKRCVIMQKYVAE